VRQWNVPFNRRKAAAVLIETPANPTMIVTDISTAVEAVARRHPHPLVMVDNTFLGPAFQHPPAIGADLAHYSATKYLDGFSDMIAGIVLARDEILIAKIKARRGLFGNILQPDECWLLDSRWPMVSLRMNRQSKNAQRIAERLVVHPNVSKVYYPTLFPRSGADSDSVVAGRFAGRNVLPGSPAAKSRIQLSAPPKDR
jgi:methionine-gamma-lyase